MRWYEILNPFSLNKNVSSYNEVSKIFLKYLSLKLQLLTTTLANDLQFNAPPTVCFSDLRNCTLCHGIGGAGISPLVTSWKGENVWDSQVNMPEATTYSFSWGVTYIELHGFLIYCLNAIYTIIFNFPQQRVFFHHCHFFLQHNVT